jgi:RNA polymerase sigma-70 factor (ECF subfamily)
MAEVETPQELDLELVRRVQRGESAAFDVLVRKYQHRIVALIGRYIADWSECQDVAQDTFVRAYRAIGSFRGDAQFYTWLHRIAVNTAKNHLPPTTAARPPMTSTSGTPSSSTAVPACATPTRRNAS